MTRKKFVKQLMALGLPRNRANSHATRCRYKGNSYAEYYAALAPVLRVRQAQDKLNVSMRMAAGYFLSGLARVWAAMARLRDDLVAHHPNPYTPGHPGPDFQNMQIMSQADHAAMHGYTCGIDLAAGPDMTAYKPVMRLDSMVINTGPVIPDMTKKTATELAEEIMEKIPHQGGGGHD